MSASYVIKTNARSALTRFTVSGLITDYIADPAKGPPGEVSKKTKNSLELVIRQINNKVMFSPFKPYNIELHLFIRKIIN